MALSMTITPNPKAYGSVAVGASATQVFTATNDGTGSVTPAAIHVAGSPAFTIESDTCTGVPVAAAGTCTFTGRFTPSGPGAYAATIELLADALTTIPTTDVTGTSPTGPALSVEPASLDVGVISLGDVADSEFIVTNTGDAVTTIGTPAITGDTQFAKLVDGCAGQALAVGATCSITVRFTPTDNTNRSATLSIPSDDPLTPLLVGLIGDAFDEGASVDADVTERREPTVAQDPTLYDTPGTLASAAAFKLTGIHNGTFRESTEATGSNVDVYTSSVGSNFLPSWRFVQSSGTKVTAKWISTSAGGSVRLSMAGSGASGDEGYIEQVVPVAPSTSISNQGNLFDAVFGSFASSNAINVFLNAQYLKLDGTTTGASVESSTPINFAGTTWPGEVLPNTTGYTPTDAAFLRIRVGIRRAGASNALTNSTDIPVTSVTAMTPTILLADIADTAQDAGYIRQEDGVINALGVGVFLGGTTGDITLDTNSGVIALNSNTAFLSKIRLQGVISASFSSNQDDYNPSGFATANQVQLTATGASRNITGFDASGTSVGRIFVLINSGDTNNIVLKNATTSTAANRILGANNADVTIRPHGMAWIVRGVDSSANERWFASAI